VILLLAKSSTNYVYDFGGKNLGLADEEGGYRTKGRTAEERSFSLNEARVIEENGGFALVLELVDPSAVAAVWFHPKFSAFV